MEELTKANLTNHFNAPTLQFSWYDHAMFILMLALSTAIGIYFGYFGKKQNSTNEYLLGGKTMGIFPISMSLISSLISGITILAVPADIYTYGLTYWLLSVVIIPVSIISVYVYLPVYYKCQVTSIYEYLELRFDLRLRRMSSLLYTLHIILYLPIVIFIPALAFSQATGINIHFITPAVCSVCIFYTTIGGLKAVVWTDTLQFTAMIGAIIAVFYMGTSSVDGISEVWRVANEGERLSFDFDLSPLKRDTFWSALLGLTIDWTCIVAATQGPMQKFIALGSMNSAKKSMVIFTFGMAAVMSSSALIGLIMYAKYYDCDPFTTGHVTRHDQLLPFYVMDVAGHIPGLPGLFIAGLFCAALSTLSATMNSLAGTIFEDFIRQSVPSDAHPDTIGRILKLIVVGIGLLCTGLVFVVEQLGGLLPLAISFGGVTNGPLIGLFTFGMLVPFANATGAFYGGISSILFVAWMVVGSQYYKAMGVITYPTKPLSTEGCEFIVNATVDHFVNTTLTETDEPFFLYRISYYYYTVIGTIILFLVGLPLSWFTKKDGEPVDMDYISPVMHWCLPKKDKPQYCTVDKAANILSRDHDEEC